MNYLVDHFIWFFVGSFVIYFLLKNNKQKKQTKEAKKLVAKAIKSGMNEPLSLHPEVDPNLCAGCSGCTKVCPEGDILRMVNNKAVLVSPTKCVGHGECERACPMNAITLVFGTKTRGMDIPRLTKNYETNVNGLYIAGELGGMGLIRNAIKQGALAGQHAIGNLDSQLKTQYDLVIVGAGPAGIATSLAAIAGKKKYICIEQGSLGGTVYNFPRQKVVMSHPFELPIVGKKEFDSNKVSKEKLLSYWKKVQAKTGLAIDEGNKFESVEKKDNVFEVKTSKGIITTKKVILCMGVRGSPRKLGVPGEDQEKVTYNLLDPEQYLKKNVVVVGGGNAGVEAAQMLGASKIGAKVHLLVRGAVFDRCNEDNISRINKMEKDGLVSIWYNSSVQEILADKVKIKKEAETIELPNDFVFVFAGAEMPHKFLMSLGVKIDKKFGETLSG